MYCFSGLQIVFINSQNTDNLHIYCRFTCVMVNVLGFLWQKLYQVPFIIKMIGTNDHRDWYYVCVPPEKTTAQQDLYIIYLYYLLHNLSCHLNNFLLS